MAFGTFLMARRASASPAGADFLCELPHRSLSSGCPPDETIFRRRRKRLETKAAYLPQPPNYGDRHLDPPPQRDLPRNRQRRSSRHCPRKGKAMTEAVMALLVLFSISVFLAHAFDAYRMR
jgi:hypothetical protein